MKKIITICAVVLFMASLTVIGVSSANAQELTRITADQAFDMKAADPDMTVIVDCRTPEEFYWVGT